MGQTVGLGAPSAPLTRAGKRLLFVVNHAGFFLSHRLPIALAARNAGYDVHIVTPRSKHVPQIEGAGLQWAGLRLSRSGRNPLREAASLTDLYRLYRRLCPDVVHHVTSKPVLYGTMVARSVHIPSVVNAISGMGHLFIEGHWTTAALRRAVGLGYRFALRHPNMRVIFQNREQRDVFIARGWIAPWQAVLIPGSGVDLTRFRPRPKESRSGAVVVLSSRMLYTKGVADFVEAARLVRRIRPDVRFVLVGEPDPDNLASISESQLRSWAAEGVVEYWGRREDMPEVLAQADIVCLPTYYPEGIPKSLIEAAASGLPIVTTDIPGCREVVADGDNGLLVPIKNPEAIAEAIDRILSDRQRAAEMGARGRLRAEEQYGLQSIIAATLQVYDDLLRCAS